MAAVNSTMTLVFYDETDKPRQIIKGDAAGLEAAMADLHPTWTWRVVAFRRLPPLGLSWVSDPEVVLLSQAPPLASLPAPEGAPR